jgi:hypothetical protein
MDDLMRPAGRPFAWARTAHRISPDLKPCYALTSKKAEHCVDRFAVSWIRCAKLIAILQWYSELARFPEAAAHSVC